MNAQRFNGRYRVTVYYKAQVLMQFQSDNVNYNIDFSANIIKDGLAHGGTRGNIYFYNLAESKINTFEKLIALGKSGDIQVSIEFSQNNQTNQYQLLSYDDVTGVFNDQGDCDYKTNLILKSGQGSVVKTFSAATYAPGALFSNVALAEGNKMVDNLSIKSCQVVSPNDYAYANGVSVTGNTFNYLTNLCNSTDNVSFIDKGVLYISRDDFIPSNPSKTTDINFLNGLLEPPHIGQINFTKKYLKKNTNLSFQFKSLLIPTLSINDVISVLGIFYTVKRVTHVIDTRQGIGYSIVEGFKNGSV
jgi:hypothetical protein